MNIGKLTPYALALSLIGVLGALRPDASLVSLSLPGAHVTRQPRSREQFDLCLGEKPLGPACDAPEIRALTATLARGLQLNSAPLSERGREVLIGDQALWAAAQKRACAVTAESRDEDCLVSALQDRMRYATTLTQSFGGLTIQRRQALAAVRLSGNTTTRPYIIDRSEFPRIDGDDRKFGAFNILAGAQNSLSPDNNAQDTQSYEIYFASDDLISVRFDQFHWPVGATAADADAHALTFLLKDSRQLAADDIFAPATKWETALSAAVAEQLRNSQNFCDGVSLQNPIIAAAIDKPEHWLVTEEGLSIVFSPHSMGYSALFSCSVTVPWEALAPVLAPTAPAPIASDAAKPSN